MARIGRIMKGNYFLNLSSSSERTNHFHSRQNLANHPHSACGCFCFAGWSDYLPHSVCVGAGKNGGNR